MTKLLKFAIRALRRDGRAGELMLVFVALIIAVASTTAVGFFTDRIQRAIGTQANALLAADLVLESRNPIPESLRSAAHANGLATSDIITFRSVVSTGEQLQLTEVKAVQAGYPLRGSLQVSRTLFGPAEETGITPAPGEAWAETRLLPALGLAVGDNIALGKVRLRITRVLVLEPDRGGDLFSIAPRLMINHADVAATGLILPASRATRRLLVAGNAPAVAEFRAGALKALPVGVKLREVRDARPELRAALRRAEQFLGLAVLSSLLVAGVAIAMAARRFAARHLDNCAVLRCLGASQRFIISVFAVEMLILGGCAGIVGALGGYAAQWGLAELLRGLTTTALPPAGWLPFATGVTTSVVALIGFAMPPLLQLKHVPPARVLRRELGPPTGSRTLPYVAAFLLLLLLAPWRAGNVNLSAYLIAGSLATICVSALLAVVAIKLLGRLRSRVGVAWRYGLANIARRAGGAVVQIVALALGIMVMLMLSLVRTDLLAGWQATLPPRAPNHFLINIQPSEVNTIRTFFAARGVASPDLHAMVRARLTHINDQAVDIDNYLEPRARRLADREFNLSWATALQEDNKIVAGRWWSADQNGQPELSVERDFAETLGFKLGDVLHFRIAEQDVSARITSLREVNWDSFNVNFFVVATPGWLESHPATFITSVYLDDQQKLVLNELVARFSSITVLDVAALMKQVRRIMDRVTRAVEYVFGFTVLAGVLVLVAALQSTHDECVRESAVLKTLGAVRSRIRLGLLAEFCTLGALAGLVAALAASLLSYVLAEYVFNISYQFNALMWPVGLLAGMIGTALVGVAGMRAILDELPAGVLRRL